MFVDRHGPYQETSIAREPSMVIEYVAAEDGDPDAEDDSEASVHFNFLLNPKLIAIIMAIDHDSNSLAQTPASQPDLPLEQTVPKTSCDASAFKASWDHDLQLYALLKPHNLLVRS